MSADPGQRTVIVAAVDDTPTSSDVVRSAIAAARGFPAGELHFIHVVEPPLAANDHPAPAFSTEELIAEGRRALLRVVNEAAERYVGRIEAHLALGFVAREILQLAADLEADLLVVGSNGHGWLGHLVCGSVARTLLNHAHCGVLVARPAQPWEEDSDGLIAPPCESCHAVQRATRGRQLWCPDHRIRSVGSHLHCRSETFPPLAAVASGAAE